MRRARSDDEESAWRVRGLEPLLGYPSALDEARGKQPTQREEGGEESVAHDIGVRVNVFIFHVDAGDGAHEPEVRERGVRMEARDDDVSRSSREQDSSVRSIREEAWNIRVAAVAARR